MPCRSQYPVSGENSFDNPYKCASLYQFSCLGSQIDPKHYMYYKMCQSATDCGETLGGGANKTFIMYMQYQPNSGSCGSTTIAYAAVCHKDELGR